MKVIIIIDDLIKSWKMESKSWFHPFINFQRLIIKIATWKDTREWRNILWLTKKESVIKHLPKEEQRKVYNLDKQISKLMKNWNLSYEDIKNLHLKVF